jgi:hypothetical protein
VKHEVFIDARGLRVVYDDVLASLLARLGVAVTGRASHVEPSVEGWTADMTPVGGPVLGPFALRGQALAAEQQWLSEHEVPIPCK